MIPGRSFKHRDVYGSGNRKIDVACKVGGRQVAVAMMLLCGWLATSNCLAQRWPDEHQSGPFFYHADFELQPLEPLLRTISSLQHDVPHQLGLGAVEEPIHVFLFSRRQTYQGYMSRYFPSVPSRQALFVKQRGPGMVFAYHGKDFEVDLRHETTHAVLHSLLPMVPLWLDEGLGEYFELPDSNRASGHPHLKSIRTHARWGRVPRIGSLEELGDLAEMRTSHYRDAWSWVHFLLHGPPPAKLALTSYLGDIAAQVPPGQLSERLQRRIPDLNQQYLLHFRNWPK